MPANLKSVQGQNAWEIILPVSPAIVTWMRLQKQAKWCKETMEQHSVERGTCPLQACLLRQQRTLVKAWKKAVKNSLKLGQTPPAQPENLKLVTR